MPRARGTSVEKLVPKYTTVRNGRWETGQLPVRPCPCDYPGLTIPSPLLVTLTLLYTSLLPLLLQLFLSIWYTQDRIPSSSATLINVSTALPGWLVNHLPWLVQYEAIVNDLWYSVDRIWAGTKLLGGMSAGFGLRVLLPTRPYETTTIVLAGWLAAGLASRLLEVFTG